MTSIEEMVRRFIDTLRLGRVDEATACFAPHGVYQEAGALPFVGHAEIAECLRGFVALDRRWDFVIDEFVHDRDEGKAAAAYRFLIEGGDGEQLERAGCALVKRSGEHFVEWREYMG